MLVYFLSIQFHRKNVQYILSISDSTNMSFLVFVFQCLNQFEFKALLERISGFFSSLLRALGFLRDLIKDIKIKIQYKLVLPKVGILVLCVPYLRPVF